MYSVVLMMAMTGGAETPDFGRRGGCAGGCYGGGYSCGGCYGGGWGCSGGGCHGGGHGGGRLFGGHGRRGHGCHGGGYVCAGGYGCAGGCFGGGYGCMGGGYGCMGGGYGCMGGGYGCAGGFGGCYGGGMAYGCAGGWGCAGGYGCAGGVVLPPVTGPAPKQKGEKIPPPVKSQLEAPATILVSLPAEAKLLVDGAATMSTSSERRLVSPTLQTGRDYHYTLTAEVVRNGQTVREERPVTVRAGEETRVQFTFTEAAVTASR
jgi:uncharacterized protein (TIGR03000 family)